MGYASQKDIEDLYGTDLLLRISDHNRDRAPDLDVIEKGLRGADEICDAYLSAQYTVPVLPAPGIVRTCAINIAVYLMAMDRTRRTEEMRVRYEDALKLLEKISTGKVGLGLQPSDPDGDGVTTNPNAQRKGRMINLGRS